MPIRIWFRIFRNSWIWKSFSCFMKIISGRYWPAYKAFLKFCRVLKPLVGRGSPWKQILRGTIQSGIAFCCSWALRKRIPPQCPSHQEIKFSGERDFSKFNLSTIRGRVSDCAGSNPGSETQPWRTRVKIQISAQIWSLDLKIWLEDESAAYLNLRNLILLSI